MPNDATAQTPIADRYVSSTTLHSALSLEEGLVAIAAAGFHWAEIWAEGAHLDPRLKPDVGGARRLLADLGLHAHSIHCPYVGLRAGHPGADTREWLSVMSDSLAIGAEVGAGLAVIHVTSDSKLMDDSMYEGSRDTMLRLIPELEQVAGRLGIRLALENLPLMPWLQRRFGSSLQQLAAAFPSAGIGFCLDTGHALINKQSQESEIRAAGSRLISIHAASNDGIADRHWSPAEGLLDWTDLQRHLTAIGYPGRFVLEVLALQAGPAGRAAVLAHVAAFARAQQA